MASHCIQYLVVKTVIDGGGKGGRSFAFGNPEDFLVGEVSFFTLVEQQKYLGHLLKRFSPQLRYPQPTHFVTTYQEGKMLVLNDLCFSNVKGKQETTFIQ